MIQIFLMAMASSIITGIVLYLLFYKEDKQEPKYSRYGFVPNWMGDKNIAQNEFKKGDRFIYIDAAHYGIQGTIIDESILRTNDRAYNAIIDSYGTYLVRQSQIIHIPPQYEINLHFTTKDNKPNKKK